MRQAVVQNACISMGIASDWAKIFHGEGGSFVVQQPDASCKSIFIDAQIVLMRSCIKEDETWKDYVRRSFFSLITKHFATFDVVILSFYFYGSVPIFKSLTQTSRIDKCKSVFAFDDRQTLRVYVTQVSFYTNVHICGTLAASCVHVCIFIYMCTCMHMYMDAYVRLWYCLTRWGVVAKIFYLSYVCICMRMYICVHVCAYRCMCICMYMYMCMSVYMYSFTFIYTHLYTHACGFTYALV